MFYGVDYYPEHWPEERWETDAGLMRKAGMNIVRIGEFAWSRMEPEEGNFDFEWIDRVIEILDKNKIRVILGTPTAGPPKWLMDKYPDIYPVDDSGRKKEFGLRNHRCFNSKDFIKYTSIIVRKMAEHFKGNQTIYGWQIDNELGDRCYCGNCKKAFQRWLKNKYTDINRVNNEWGTVFWSQTYKDFDEIINPGYYVLNNINFHNPGLVLDYYRFCSDSIFNFLKLQADIIREVDPGKPITHNYIIFNNSPDYYKLGTELDFISFDNYPCEQYGGIEGSALNNDATRSIKKKSYWVMEQLSGQAGWNTIWWKTPAPGQMRLFAYQAIAHGADGILYFRWRSCRFGTEQYCEGILGHDGLERRRYHEAKKTGEELQKISGKIAGTTVQAKVAIIRSGDNDWSFEIQPIIKDRRYYDYIMRYYGALFRQNIQVDIISPQDNLAGYKVLIAPALALVNETIKYNLEHYVRQGGILVSGFRTGTRGWNNQMTDDVQPGLLKDIFGIEVEEYGIIQNSDLNSIIMEQNKTINIDTWYEILNPISAKPIGVFSGDYFSGKSALTVNSYGNGRAYYIGGIPTKTGINEFIEYLIENEEIQKLYPEPLHGVEFTKRVKGKKEYMFILNHNSKEISLELDKKYIDILTGNQYFGNIVISGKDLIILEYDR